MSILDAITNRTENWKTIRNTSRRTSVQTAYALRDACLDQERRLSQEM